MAQETAKIFSEVKEGTVLFTAHLTDDLYTFLGDDFNFETVLRLVKDIPQQQGILRINDFKLRCKKLVTYIFTRITLNSFLTQPLHNDLNFTYNEFGKPSIDKVEFNSSSSNDIISIIISTNSVIGIDLSHSRQRIGGFTEFEPIFHPDEFEYLKSLPKLLQNTHFNLLWTLKEAFTKYLGTGLNIDLSKFYFSIKDFDMIPPKYGTNTINPFTITWNNSIIRFQDNFLNLGSESFFCQSGILQMDENSVIVSIIHKEKNLEVSCYNIDMLKIFDS